MADTGLLLILMGAVFWGSLLRACRKQNLPSEAGPIGVSPRNLVGSVGSPFLPARKVELFWVGTLGQAGSSTDPGLEWPPSLLVHLPQLRPLDRRQKRRHRRASGTGSRDHAPSWLQLSLLCGCEHIAYPLCASCLICGVVVIITLFHRGILRTK